MGKITDFIKNLGHKSKENREQINQMAEQLRMQRIAEDRQKPSSQRLIERYEEEKLEKKRKSYLELLEKERDNEYKFGHNPLDTKTITGKAQWQVLKTKNQFKDSKNIFSNQKNIIKCNKKCY